MDKLGYQTVWRRVRPIAVMGIIAATLGAFVWFFVTHPEVAQRLRSVGLPSAVMLVALYGVMTCLLAFIYDLTLRLCGTRLSYGENFLLTAYSSIVNFFGPLQSGPGMRMVYLKKKHGVSARRYMLATLLYYAVFAMVSAGFFVLGTGVWWLVPPAMIAVGAVSTWVIKRHVRRVDGLQLQTSWQLLAGFVAGVVGQLVVVALIYAVELQALQQSFNLQQVLAYTGTANFALFVSLTPGALGFREAFLLFTRQLTGLDSGTILAASAIDRTAYIVFLALLFVVILLALGQSRLRALRAE